MIKLLRKLIFGCDCQKRPRIELDKYGRDKKVVASTKANFKPAALPTNPPKSTRPISNLNAKPVKAIL